MGRGARAAAPTVIGATLFGLGTGAATATSGVSMTAALAMPPVLFTGVAQLAYVQMVAVATPFASIAFAIALTNLRYLIYAAIVATWPRPAHRGLRFVAPYFVTETSFALTSARKPADRIPFMVGAGLVLGTTWTLSCIAGALLGSLLPSLKHAWAVPAIVLAPILVAVLRDRTRLMVAVVAFAIGLALWWLPYRLAPLVAGVAATVLVMAVFRPGRTPT